MSGPSRIGWMDLVADRFEFLERLAESPAHKPRLEDDLDCSRSTIDRAIRRLEAAELVERTSEGYVATPTGRVAVDRYCEYLSDQHGVDAARAVLSSLPADCAVPTDLVVGGETVEAAESSGRAFERLGRRLRDANRYAAALPEVGDSRHLRLLHSRVTDGELSTRLLLDDDLVDRLAAEFPGLVADLVDEGRTVVAAIHDLDLAARYCDELRLLHGGSIRAAGPPESVLTDATVEAAFGVRATVTEHPITGSASVTAFGDDGEREGDARVHVVGGGGAATPLLHRLDAAGFEPSVGAVSADDRDAETARTIDADLVTVPPYAPVDDEARAAVADRIDHADAVVVADVTIAPGNRPVFDAVLDASAPVVVVDGRPIEDRNAAGAPGQRLDDRLRERGVVVADEARTVVDAVRRVVRDDAPRRGIEADPRP